LIKLTRFKTKDHEFVLNAELIETVEETPDTVITLIMGIRSSLKRAWTISFVWSSNIDVHSIVLADDNHS